jgi:hypothetical protein
MFSTREQNDLELVNHRERRDLIYPLLVFPSGTVFQVRCASCSDLSVFSTGHEQKVVYSVQKNSENIEERQEKP